MKVTYHPSDSRGKADYGWLKTHYSFSFANYYNPERMGFGLLRVLNDDRIEGGTGFGEHEHNNMEIVTIPLKGALKHQDSMGNQTVIRSGEVQAMSAGSGVAHSEMNASNTEPAEFLQIWIETEKQNITPAYSQQFFDAAQRQGGLQLVASPKKSSDEGVKIHQNAWLCLGNFKPGEKIHYPLRDSKTNGVYLFVIKGKIKLDQQIIGDRDAMGIEEVDSMEIEILQESELLIIEIPIK